MMERRGPMYIVSHTNCLGRTLRFNTSIKTILGDSKLQSTLITQAALKVLNSMVTHWFAMQNKEGPKYSITDSSEIGSCVVTVMVQMRSR